MCIHSHSVDFLAAQSGSVQKVSAGGCNVVREQGQSLAVYQRQQSLVTCGPNTVPRSIEWVRHCWAQHVVQVDFGNQAKALQEEEVIEKQDAGGKDGPPHVP